MALDDDQVSDGILKSECKAFDSVLGGLVDCGPVWSVFLGVVFGGCMITVDLHQKSDFGRPSGVSWDRVVQKLIVINEQERGSWGQRSETWWKSRCFGGWD